MTQTLSPETGHRITRKFYDTAGATQRTGRTAKHIRTAIRTGALPATKPADHQQAHWVITVEDLDAWAAAGAPLKPRAEVRR